VEVGFHSLGVALRSAVYMLVYKGKVMYVGQSTQPLVRVYSHIRSKKMKQTTFGPRMLRTIPFDDIWLRPCAVSELNEVEKGLILKYRPQFNTKHNDGPQVRIDLKELVRTLAPTRGKFHPTIGHIERRI
jgi:hypothetical protein